MLDIGHIGSMSKETPFPVKKLVNLTEDQARRVSEFRFEQRLPSENEAIRRLIELGLAAHSEGDDSPKPHGDKLAVPAGRAGGRRTVRLGEPEEPDEQ